MVWDAFHGAVEYRCDSYEKSFCGDETFHPLA